MIYATVAIAVVIFYGVLRLDMAVSSLHRIAVALDQLVDLKRRN